eukprot:358571-Chlamydomonas_euryale.AAC.3
MPRSVPTPDALPALEKRPCTGTLLLRATGARCLGRPNVCVVPIPCHLQGSSTAAAPYVASAAAAHVAAEGAGKVAPQRRHTSVRRTWRVVSQRVAQPTARLKPCAAVGLRHAICVRREVEVGEELRGGSCTTCRWPSHGYTHVSKFARKHASMQSRMHTCTNAQCMHS